MLKFNLLSLITVFAFLLSSQDVLSQKYQVPHYEFRASVGLLPVFLKDSPETEVQPYSLEFRYRIDKKFSVGILGGHSISQSVITHMGNQHRARNNYKWYALRGAVHTDPFEKWEIYGGIMLGYADSNVELFPIPDNQVSATSAAPKIPVRDGIMFSGFVGTNYNLTQRINLFGEIGYGLSLVSAGIAVRF